MIAAAGLGILPLLAAGAIIGTGGFIWSTAQRLEEDSRAREWKRQLLPPSSPPPPPAPATREQLINPRAWTPDLMYREMAADYEAWKLTAIPAPPPLQPPESDNRLLWAAAGMLGISVILYLRR